MKYKDSGVNIDKANRAKAAIAEHVKSTWSPSVLSETGAFGGLFRLGNDYSDPVLVSSIDGVGTKLLVAGLAGRFDSVGRDLVNHCVNDILVQGAKPLFFLDYIAAGRLEPAKMADIVAGVAAACRENRCALIGGETAEMPGMYSGDDFDIAGCIVGVVERGRIIDGSTIKPGDVVLALQSSGLHTNGYSLARRIFFEELGLDVSDRVGELGCTVGDELLKVHRSYLAPVSTLIDTVDVKGIAHITGGGIVENVPRILPEGCDVAIERAAWEVPPVFRYLREKGSVDDDEMFRVFNMGLGMIVIVPGGDAEKVLKAKEATDIRRVGEVVKGSGRVRLV